MGEHEAADKVESKKDATDRSKRSLVQGLIATALVAVGGVVGDMVVPGVAIDWPTFSLALVVAVLTAVASYLQRRAGL